MGTLWDLISWRASESPDSVVVGDDHGVELTCGQLRDEVARMAAGLVSRGIGPGSRVSWVLSSRVETIVFFSALARVGALQNPIVPIYGEPEIEFITAQVGTEYLVTPGVFRSVDFGELGRRVGVRVGFEVLDIGELAGGFASPVQPTADPDEPRWVFTTSGTTSTAKCVMHSDRTLIAAGEATVRVGFGPAVRWGSAVPVSHIAGPTMFTAALRTGASLFFIEVFDPVKTCEQLQEWNCDLVGGVGAIVHAMFEYQKSRSERAFPSLRVINAGGGPRIPKILERAQAELGCDVVPSYGMTECPYVAAATPEDSMALRAAGEGPAAVGVSIRIVDECGAELGSGREGEIRVTGPQMFLGYVDSTLDAAAFDERGFFKTGDLGYLTPEGYLVVTGRLKEMVIRNGENLSVRPIEDLLLQHPDLADSTVIGLPHSVTGECVCAVVVPRPGAAVTLEELRTFCAERGLMRQKLPERLEIVDRVPRNALGKAMKPELRQRFSRG